MPEQKKSFSVAQRWLGLRRVERKRVGERAVIAKLGYDSALFLFPLLDTPPFPCRARQGPGGTRDWGLSHRSQVFSPPKHRDGALLLRDNIVIRGNMGLAPVWAQEPRARRTTPPWPNRARCAEAAHKSQALEAPSRAVIPPSWPTLARTPAIIPSASTFTEPREGLNSFLQAPPTPNTLLQSSPH